MRDSVGVGVRERNQNKNPKKNDNTKQRWWLDIWKEKKNKKNSIPKSNRSKKQKNKMKNQNDYFIPIVVQLDLYKYKSHQINHS